MPDALDKFLGSHPAWHVARTRKGFSVRVRTPGRGRRFELITYIPDTTSRGEQLANAIAALPDTVRQLVKFHDLHFNDPERASHYRHKAGDKPEACRCCATIASALEVQP